jgi:3-oxocholest-4-en-26-oyl-CoA dehydrogenase alpha subunit
VHVGLGPEHVGLRDRLRAYYAELMTPEVEVALDDPERAAGTRSELTRRMAADGWLGIGWPAEYGGGGATPIEQQIFYDESMRAGAPVPMLGLNTVGPTLMRFGTEEQKGCYLPRILAGEITFAIGYTEPDAGTDLAALRTLATRDGDEYVVNGLKIFTSLANAADYVWLAVRTDPEAKKHKGISILIVPNDSAGFRVVPIDNICDLDTNITYYEDVRVPVANRVGDENAGWQLITNQLNHERVTLCAPGMVERLADDVRRWAQTTFLADGRRVVDQEWVQRHLGLVHAKLEFLRLANWRVAWLATEGVPLDPSVSSTVKVFGTELYQEATRLLMEIVGSAATIARGSAGAVIEGRLEAFLRRTYMLTFGGGTNEMQRDLIAVFGLGMPGTPR